MRIFAIIGVAAILCGCSTTTPAERLANNQASCAAYGFKPGTDAYSTCMMQMDLTAQQDEKEQRQRIGDALSEMGDSMQRNRPVTCNTFGSANRGFGNTVYGNSTTTCY